MSDTMATLENMVRKMIGILDRDIEHLKDTINNLKIMYDMILSRDDRALGGLLESIKTESTDYRHNEMARQSIRNQIAMLVGCSLDKVTLSGLETVLDGQIKQDLSEKKDQLQKLAEKLKTQHLSTVFLLRDCAKFNRLLINNIFSYINGNTGTYNNRGNVTRSDHHSSMSMEV